MNFKFDLINQGILFVMLINSLSGLIIYIKNRRDRINLLFFILTASISMWELSMLGYRGFSDHDTVLIMSRLLYFFAIIIPTAFLYFVIVFPKLDTKLSLTQIYLVPIPVIILCILSLYPDGLINDVTLYNDRETFIFFNQINHMLFGLYVVCYFSLAYYIIYKKFVEADIILKVQLRYIFIGTFGSTLVTLVTNLAFLYFGIFSFNWIGQIGIIFMMTFIFYSVIKLNLFNIKLIAVEIVTFSLWIFMLVRVLLTNTRTSLIIEGSVFILTVIIGTILIKSVLHEIKQRQKIENLALDLKKAYSQIEELNAGHVLDSASR